MERNKALSLLGLSLRAGRLAVGEDDAADALRAGRAKLLLLSADASDNTRSRWERLAGKKILLTLPSSREETGRALGRATAAVVAVTDAGLAAAVAAALAEGDPERYGSDAAVLDRKAQKLLRRRGKHRTQGSSPGKSETKAPPERGADPGGGPSRRRKEDQTRIVKTRVRGADRDKEGRKPSAERGGKQGPDGSGAGGGGKPPHRRPR